LIDGIRTLSEILMVKWEWFAMFFGGEQAAALHGRLCTLKKPLLSSRMTNNMLCFSVFCFCDC